MGIAERLKAAREKFGFETAADAARALGVKVYTYSQHENGTRGFKRDSAEKYARKFKVPVEWLLYGHGDDQTTEPSAADIEQMIREALDGVVTVQTRLADLPRIVAPVLHEQLERFRADRAGRGLKGERPSPGKAARSPVATKQDEMAR